jgi:hypothetical protein
LLLRFAGVAQQGEEVKAALKNQIRRKGIHAQSGLANRRSELQLAPRSVPLRLLPIIVRQGDAMPAIADLIHKAERRAGKRTLLDVIFDEHRCTGYARGFAQQNHWVVGVVQHVDEHDHVDTGGPERKSRAVEGTDRNFGFRPHQDIDTFDRNVRTALHNKASEPAIAASNIEYACAQREHFSDVTREDFDTAPVNISAMDTFKHIYFRRSPRRLMKKLARAV